MGKLAYFTTFIFLFLFCHLQAKAAARKLPSAVAFKKGSFHVSTTKRMLKMMQSTGSESGHGSVVDSESEHQGYEADTEQTETETGSGSGADSEKTETETGSGTDSDLSETEPGPEAEAGTGTETEVGSEEGQELGPETEDELPGVGGDDDGNCVGKPCNEDRITCKDPACECITIYDPDLDPHCVEKFDFQGN